MSSFFVAIFTLSASVFDDESPSKGLNKGVGDGVGLLSVEASEGSEKVDWVDVGMPPTSPGR